MCQELPELMPKKWKKKNHSWLFSSLYSFSNKISLHVLCPLGWNIENRFSISPPPNFVLWPLKIIVVKYFAKIRTLDTVALVVKVSMFLKIDCIDNPYRWSEWNKMYDKLLLFFDTFSQKNWKSPFLNSCHTN